MAEDKGKKTGKKATEQEDKRRVYIGGYMKTPYLTINRFTVLLDKPKNFEEIVKKAPEIEKLFVSVEEFSKVSKDIKRSEYHKQLTKDVIRKLKGGN